ncbi:NADH dehydrogenase subunit 4L (mitochondrion) [Astatotilapia calliptera]|uniref:NADH-ubiquinone oxidoreductase chain 4L n=12 Tax=Haplochromini TaxID=319058 RepID=A0A0K2CIR5_9CICH|nr:NADH dehydrogenase subunit 4L [Diplotaxodon limnothrissa]YP_006666176.1 NADH dehydrogenase subunit 4L [Petrotilapia nigra]YP_006666202.1 NADH dehydrogenase subunit 4L [Pseudotropheus crabro]YP_006666215.1 NADH dehydrogenase subunit 4L [Astatotilapia calliptera]YP_006666241.1 NADH dehydrogenase subunit 4L [Genyochromis mento]YP_006666267.1 NADH dehydrogenase subunit 4L [Cynotilapia afra]YP_009145567.1 NADH dehydrogenase subunit 4L [Haplochromis burtoni]YP_009166322.1 NADH dehydrogenase sub
MTPTHFAFSSTFLLGLAGLAFHRTHLLSALLCLEGMMLSLFIALSMWTLQLNSANFSASPMLLLAFSACEASAGLALLVATARTHGTDRLQNLNLLQC